MAIDIKQVNTSANTRVGTALTQKGQAQAQQSNELVPARTPQKSDSVSITAQAQQLQSVQTKMADIPEVDKKKVEEIKLAIAEGRYKIDPEKLATNIASFENELKDLS